MAAVYRPLLVLVEEVPELRTTLAHASVDEPLAVQQPPSLLQALDMKAKGRGSGTEHFAM